MKEEFFTHYASLQGLKIISKENSGILNIALDGLLNSHPHDNCYAKEKAHCLELLCSLTENGKHETSKVAHLIYMYSEGIFLDHSSCRTLLKWAINSLKLYSESIRITNDVLSAICSVVRRNKMQVPKEPLISDLAAVLSTPVLDKDVSVSNADTLMLKIKCLRFILQNLDEYQIAHIVDNVLKQTHVLNYGWILSHANQDSSVELLAHALLVEEELELVRAICELNRDWLSKNLCAILSKVILYAPYGLPYYETLFEKPPLYFYPSELFQYLENQTTAHPETKSNSKRKTNQRKQRKNVEMTYSLKSSCANALDLPELEVLSLTSESDYSDLEAFSVASQLVRIQRNIRFTALSLLLYIMQCTGKKEMVGYWNVLLSGEYSILRCLIADSAPRIRIAIFSVLTVMLNDGASYISQAHYSGKASSFTSWSAHLAELMVNVHLTLCRVLTKNESVLVMQAGLRCLAVIVAISPYHRLGNDLLQHIFKTCSPFLQHKNHSVCVLAYKIFEEIVTLSPQSEAQLKLLCNKSDGITMDDNTPIDSHWLRTVCISKLLDDKCAVSVKNECLRLLSSLAKHFPHRLMKTSCVKDIVSTVAGSLSSKNTTIQQSAAKAFECLAPSISLTESVEGIDGIETWKSLLEGPLAEMLRSKSGDMVAASCDCLNAITDNIFQSLPPYLQTFVMEALFECVNHPENCARSAAIRTLGSAINFTHLTKDTRGVCQIADRIICCLSDVHLPARVNASWAFANLSEVLLSSFRLGNFLPDETLLINLLEASKKTEEDNSQVKVCSMRAIGNVLALITEHDLENDRIASLVVDAIEVLVHNATNDKLNKVRWNACYALANMMRNLTLFNSKIISSWQGLVLEALGNLMANSPNYKVRQAAAHSLTSITERHNYGSHFTSLWNRIADAFGKQYTSASPTEYSHYENFMTQICRTFVHFTSLIIPTDLPNIRDSLQTNKCSIDEQFQKRITSIVCVQMALNHVQDLARDSLLSVTDKETINLLHSVVDGNTNCEASSNDAS